MEQFYAALSGLAARCSFGTLESRVLCVCQYCCLSRVFAIMTNREAQIELCRTTKLRKKHTG